MEDHLARLKHRSTRLVSYQTIMGQFLQMIHQSSKNKKRKRKRTRTRKNRKRDSRSRKCLKGRVGSILQWRMNKIATENLEIRVDGNSYCKSKTSIYFIRR